MSQGGEAAGIRPLKEMDGSGREKPLTPATTSGSDGGAVTVLCVCTGNICRSPAAERLLAARLGSAVSVSSAGIGALVGQPISPPMDEFLAAVGADASRFAARQLSEALLWPAEVVLGMTLAHRSDAVELWPRAVRRAFSLKELARLLSELNPAELPGEAPADRFRAAVAWAATQRRPVGTPGGDDVPDPYRRGETAYREAFTQVEAAVEVIGAAVAPVGSGA